MSTYAHRPVFSSKGARRNLRTLLALALLALVTVPATAQIIINEVDADTIGTDTLEFIELYDGGVGNTALDGLVVVLLNGSDDASYDAFDLDGFSTDANGYFLLGNAAVSPIPGIVFSSNGLQNGADAVALYSGDAADFPNDTPVTDVNLIDAIVYDTNDGDDDGLLDVLVPGQPQVNEGGGGDQTGHSNQRCPNGFGGPRNTGFYAQFAPTPGETNCCLAPTNLELKDDTILTTETFEACDTIFLGPNFAIMGLGNVTLRAGNRVVFRNDVFVASTASLRVIIELPSP